MFLYSFIVSNNLVWLIVLLLSFLPIVESKGAIFLGVSNDIWGDCALSYWQSFFISFLGSTIITFVLIIVLRFFFKNSKNKLIKKVCNCLQNNFFKPYIYKIDEQVNKHKTQNTNKKFSKDKLENRLKMTAVFLLTALPIPGTGVWSCSFLAVLLGLNFYKSFLCVTIGNLFCCVILTVFAMASSSYVTFILIAMVVFICLLLIYKVIEITVSLCSKAKNF